MIRKKKLSQYLRMDTGARLLRSILSQPKLGLVLIDLDGTIMFANSNIMSMIGSDKSMRNLSMFKFLLPQDTVMITELVSELLHNTSDVYPTYKLNLRKSETHFQTFEAKCMGIYSDAGMLECIELSLLPLGEPYVVNSLEY
jgi:PAS domain-containing protein